jgi:PAS domain S-box-containing protein
MPTALFQALIEQSDQLVFCLDREGNFSYANSAFCHLLGYNFSDLKGRPMADFIYPKTDENAIKVLNIQVDKVPETCAVQFSILNRHGVLSELEGRYSSHIQDKSSHALLFTLSKKEVVDSGLESLKEMEHIFNLLLENTEESFIMLDRSLNIVLLNKIAIQRSIKLLGKEFKVGQPILSYALPERVEMLKKLYESVLRGERHESVSPIPQKDGSTLYYHIIYSPVRNRQNEITGVFVNTADITEKFNAEALLKRSENFYREFLESSSDIFMLCNPQGSILYCSPSIVRILGYTAGEVQGKNFLELVQKKFLTQTEWLFALLIQQPQIHLREEIKLNTKSKKSIWVELAAQNKLDNSTLQAIKFTIRNIDARKNALDEIQKKNLLIEGIANNINCIIFRFNSKGIIKDFFGKGLNIFSETGGEHIGKSMWDILPDQMKKIEKAKDEVINYRTRGVRSGKYWAFENFIFREDTGNYLGFALDISDKEQQELKLIEYKERLETAQQNS